ncbi:MAG: hypothetical protein C4538_02915 [Nitrospiraceae bacterium]|nr:MAG: hypothetical protein C4538_02915 [Nitrospiraceae bacterium]
MEYTGEFGFSPPLIPIIYKLLGKNAENLANVQFIFSICSWIFLAYAVAWSLKNLWLQPFAYLLILGLSLSHIISLWNKTILSESLTISFFICFVGIWILLVQNRSITKTAILIAVSTLFVLVRNANAYLLLFLAGIIIVVSIAIRLQPHRRYYISIAIIFSILFLISNATSDSKNQWTGYFLNVVSTRILPDEKIRTYFEKHGMPVTEALMSRSGKWSHEDDFAYYNDPQLEQFREWLYAHGKSTYIKFLVTHPVYLFIKPLHEFQDMFFSSRLIYYAPKGFTESKFGKLVDYISAWGLYPAYVFLTGVFFGLTLLFAISKRSLISWVPLVSILLVYPLAVLVWHGDSHEIDRHMLPIVVQARLGFILLFLFAIDAIISENYLNADKNKKGVPNIFH